MVGIYDALLQMISDYSVMLFFYAVSCQSFTN